MSYTLSHSCRMVCVANVSSTCVVRYCIVFSKPLTSMSPVHRLKSLHLCGLPERSPLSFSLVIRQAARAIWIEQASWFDRRCCSRRIRAHPSADGKSRMFRRCTPSINPAVDRFRPFLCTHVASAAWFGLPNVVHVDSGSSLHSF